MRQNLTSLAPINSVVTGLLGQSLTRPSEKEMREEAAKFAPILGEPSEVIYQRIKDYWDLEREVVIVHRYGNGDQDFDIDKDYADVLSNNGKSKKAFAWKDPETGKLTLAKSDELKQFRAKHPDFQFPSDK